ncbi:A/G-specific adenine glycosylase [Cognatiluteimonas profundi]|uniref:A/G-specific adenine glycosylase n=1 Tax=Cognatiluteimonas profundi TaxID=2594501 RepID=UPI00131B5913|nr:A/G-specific adenine glycosylase [Lysobacter profundi]
MSGDQTFATRLLAWFDGHGRKDLPWQHPRSPYRVWLSEVMLQQTQVQVVVPYFERFVAALPDVRALAAADPDDVLALWSGLGYYARARNLQAAAKLCVAQHDGDLPRDLDALVALPGIGRSTAGAILAQAWGDRFPILDGNVKRVLARYHGIEAWPGAPATQKALWLHADRHLPHARLADYVQAQMDLGATLCRRHDPACGRCPLNTDCVAQQTGRTALLPARKPGKPLPERSAFVLLAMDEHARILMQRRPPTGIWPGLWSLPQAEDDDAARDWFKAHLHGDYDASEALVAIAHAFTHYRVTLQPLRWSRIAARTRVEDNTDLRWVDRHQLVSLGIPAPIRTLLEAQ